MRQALGAPGALSLSPDAGLAEDDEMAPHQMAARVLADYVASQKAADVGQTGQDPGVAASTPASATTAMTAAFQPYQDAFAPSIDTSDVVPASPPGGEALSAESAAVPPSAQVQTSGSAQRAALPSPSPALDPTGQFLRPELSGGPDSLVTALAGDHPNTNPLGFVVDPKTGAVSRWLVRIGADALQPGQTDLVPVSPQEKQSYLE